MLVVALAIFQLNTSVNGQVIGGIANGVTNVATSISNVFSSAVSRVFNAVSNVFDYILNLSLPVYAGRLLLQALGFLLAIPVMAVLIPVLLPMGIFLELFMYVIYRP